MSVAAVAALEASGAVQLCAADDSTKDPLTGAKPEGPFFSASVRSSEATGLGNERTGAATRQEEGNKSASRDVSKEKAPKPKRYLTLLPSVFEGRPPVLLFPYTVACLAEQRNMERSVPTRNSRNDLPKLYYGHTDAVHEYNAVINTMREGGLYRIRSDSLKWSLLWGSHPSPEVLRSMPPLTRTNHFPGSWHLSRKDLLWRNLSRMQRKFGRPYQITPQGYVLPKGFAAWEAARLRQPDALWIWKPCSQSCGRGIKVLGSALTPEETQELNRKRGIVQRYVANPHTIDGYKYDLRIYVVVVSYDPLKVYINHEGLVRCATEKYSCSPDTLASRCMHLTNYSVNKQSPVFVQNMDKAAKTGENEESGSEDGRDGGSEERPSKLSLKDLRAYLERKGLDYDALFERIKDVCIKTLIAVEPSVRDAWKGAFPDAAEVMQSGYLGDPSTSTCFEMYGFDIIVDDDLKPWLLEVNICPSLSSGSPLDKRIKTQLVADTMTLVGLQPPPNLWGGCVRQPSESASNGTLCCSRGGPQQREPLSDEELEKRTKRLSKCNPAEAIALFDDRAWDAVLNFHDENMRCGDLECIFPLADSGQYSTFFAEETYGNVILQKWQEAGGGDMFRRDWAGPSPPAWVPRQICFQRT
eukprot:gnl/TRDRNA2_/TRDRNA2_173350_c1_seq1.p1 gnl/TRDRNA2_/TRDRNA2_173350_c1~~gnl/TRDRNA2_/TRDRNA2_173350_c1_seq1.p1  ORF type:complete len:728 (+),score=98.84 gnl/TRDRNA2_/TRDRNA2_173350_c1_seq1:263-2185(+)